MDYVGRVYGRGYTETIAQQLLYRPIPNSYYGENRQYRSVSEYLNGAGEYLDDAKSRLLADSTRLRLRFASKPRPLDTSRAVRSLSTDPTVLFLCHGNICRSPLAERYARKYLEDRDVDRFTVDSAGFIEREGRPSPEFAVEAARAYGVDLSEHRSKRVTRDLLDRSDAVFLMDTKNYCQLRTEFDGAADRAYFLEPFRDDDGEAFEIDDPYGQSTEAFEVAYDGVTDAVDGLLERALPVTEADTPKPIR